MTDTDVAQVLSASLARIQNELTALRRDVQHMDGTHEELNELDDRVDELEADNDATKAKVKDLTATVERLSNSVTAVELFVTDSWNQANALLLEIRAAVLAARGGPRAVRDLPSE